MEFNFDIMNFLLGCLTRLILTSLLRLHALKELRLKLNKIGVDRVGVERQPRDEVASLLGHAAAWAAAVSGASGDARTQ